MSLLRASRWSEYIFVVTDPARQNAPHRPQKDGESHWVRMLPNSLPRRYSRIILAILVASGCLYTFHAEYLSTKYFNEQESISQSPIAFPEVQQDFPDDGLPPLYEAYREYEDSVSERILDRNATRRYINFANRPTGCGWGNVVQEMIFGSLLTSEANLGYVYDDYSWDADGRNYSTFNGKLIPARVPLSTMLSGHLLGLSEAEALGTSTPPRSISRRVYERICPKSERVLIKRKTVQAYLKKIQSPVNLDADTGLGVLHGWLTALNSPEYNAARCIEIEQGSVHVFDIWLFGDARVQSLWTRISMSPTLQHWDWSPLVLRAFERKAHLFAPSNQPTGSSFLSNLFAGPWSLPGATESHPPYQPPAERLKSSEDSAIEKRDETKTQDRTLIPPKILDSSEPLPLLALHVRRGDFLEHCANLAEWGSEYSGMNSFPDMRVHDAFVAPRVASTPEEHAQAGANPSKRRIFGNETLVASMEDRKRIYQIHCYPDAEQIARRVREVVHDYVSFAQERERMQNTPWWAWPAVAKDERDKVAGPSMEPSNDGEPDLTERTHLTPNDLLRKVFIQTNGETKWLEEVKQALVADAERSRVPVDASHAPEDGWAFEWHWEDVITSRDLELGWEEKPVAHALDSYISQRAEVFVGNGFSSLTSHVVMLRKFKGFNLLQTRFWYWRVGAPYSYLADTKEYTMTSDFKRGLTTLTSTAA